MCHLGQPEPTALSVPLFWPYSKVIQTQACTACQLHFVSIFSLKFWQFFWMQFSFISTTVWIHSKKEWNKFPPALFPTTNFWDVFPPNMTYCLVILISQQEEKLQYINLLSNKKSSVCENDQVKSSTWWKTNFENLHIEKHYSASPYWFRLREVSIM